MMMDKSINSVGEKGVYSLPGQVSEDKHPKYPFLRGREVCMEI